MIETINDSLSFSVPNVHKDARCGISFVRTLRIPDDNRSYPLPAGLGHFPLHHVDDFQASVPQTWRQHGGVFVPMYQSEALWLSFSSNDYPFAIKIAAGKINAVTGEAWSERLSNSPQDYVVIPTQPWLDGFAIGEGLIRQFVAMPQGEGYTAEEQLTGQASHGGIQIIAYPMKRERYAQLIRERRLDRDFLTARSCCYESMEMGLAPGGLMKQEIYDDQYGVDAWDQSTSSRCFVHIVNSESYRAFTGCRPPSEPITASEYASHGIPWFDYYDSDATALQGAPKLAKLDSVGAKKVKLGQVPDEQKITIQEHQIKHLGSSVVRDGDF